MFSRLALGVIPCAVLTLLGLWFVYAKGRNAQIQVTPVVIMPTNSDGDDAYYIFDNGDPDDFLEGDQFFGSQDKLGVRKNIHDGFPNQIASFVTIGNDNADREAFLANDGHTFESPSSTWDVQIHEVGDVMGVTRASVTARLGKDRVVNGGTGLHIEAELYEIWQLSGPPAGPSLLERSRQWHNGLMTNAESPTDDGLTWPAGITGGSGDDDMGQ